MREGRHMARKVSRARPLTSGPLVRGRSGPAGTRLRLARPGDTEQVAQLLQSAGVRLDPAIGEVIEAGTVASTLLLGLDHGPEAVLGPLAEAVTAGRPEDAMPGLFWVLVAEGRGGGLVGALEAVAPTNVLGDGIAGGVPLAAVMAGAARITKLRTVTVAEEARGQGIGQTLIRLTVRAYRQVGFALVYGQFAAGSGLQSYYTREGFTVLEHGRDIDLRRVALPIIIRSDPADPEQLFVRWL